MQGQGLEVDGRLSTISPRIEIVRIFGNVPRQGRLVDDIAALGQKLPSALEVHSLAQRPSTLIICFSTVATTTAAVVR